MSIGTEPVLYTQLHMPEAEITILLLLLGKMFSVQCNRHADKLAQMCFGCVADKCC